MKIVFWSPVHGQAGMTSNLLIIALICGIHLKKRCLITQTHFSYNNLEAPLVESNSKSNGDYFRDVGIDTLIRRFKAERISKNIIENCCISIPDTNVNLLPGTTKANREAFDYEIGMIAPGLFREIEAYYDLVFIDANPSVNTLSERLMREANLVVINLSQNLSMTDMFQSQMDNSITARKFYLFGNYDSNSKYNINNIRRKYANIKFSNSGVIPYNTGFKDAQIDSRVAEFTRRNVDYKKAGDNYYFIMKAVSAAEKILKMAEEESVAGRGKA